MHVTVQCGGDNVTVSVCDGVTGTFMRCGVGLLSFRHGSGCWLCMHSENIVVLGSASGHWWAFL